ncbi:outer membrane porin HofQ [Posidoniimonas polymericola]|uniref:Outer membrane porin HofQ n=1 Tax=Posidoniimonas polymericola TaxID=2528002 RepID=A0A5C5YFH7_9BACT|nr:general secretion pathway protein GspD [Posidoniimonas polymericola]TWT73553.1 outer membrane porin HofQ [Posidoniimonas polymericola]
MNAQGNLNRAGTILLTALLVAATPSASFGQANQPRQMSRQEVDSLLSEARAAIAKGDLTRADALVRRAESSGIRYPMLHFGDTPSTLRRDLAKAVKDAPRPVAAKPAAGSGYATTSADNTPPLPLVVDAGAAARPLPGVSESPAPVDAVPGTPKEQALQLMAASRASLRLGNLPQAETYAARASRLNVPEEQFTPEEDRPSRLAWDLQRARYEADAGMLTSNETTGAPRYAAQQALHVAEEDGTLNQPATLVIPDDGPRLAQNSRYNTGGPALPGLTEATAGELIKQGETALRSGDRDAALNLFRKANARSSELDLVAQARVRDHLSLLEGSAVPEPLSPPAPVAPGAASMIDSAAAAQQVLVRQLSTDVGKRQLEARRLRENEPKAALDLLQTTRKEVEDSQLSADYRRALLARVDAGIADLEKFIEDNRAQIELDEHNAAVLADLDRGRAAKQNMQQKIAESVDQFNKLQDEARYPEAELVAKRLYELAPNEPVVQQIWLNAKMMRREFSNRQMQGEKEEAIFRSLDDVEGSSYADVFDNQEMTFNSETWGGIKNRKSLSQRDGEFTQSEIEIRQKLKAPVQMRYRDRPLSEVVDSLSQLTGINIHLDQRGLSQEGVTTDTPVTLDLANPVMLKSALNLMLTELHLAYVVKDEVLMITSEQRRDGDVKVKTYYVADLVTPIPNFVPSNNIGLQGLINDAHAALGYGAGGGAPGPMAFVNHQPQVGADGKPLPEELLANQMAAPSMGGGMNGGNVPLGMGPGGMGGGANADFDGLIDLIVSTVASETWAENGGGEAEIRPFVGNLSLIISQTQAVHEEIEDLLEQLRRLQDLQITIEVRFIRLNDSFFERIGIDFDMNINDNTVGTTDLFATNRIGSGYETPRRSGTVGLDQSPSEGLFPTFTSDLDIPFRQGGFGVAVPQFGGFDPSSAASFGFAILSDIEAYFLINAAQGDERTNVLNAPKVTLFNGQTAFVADTSQSPFVISVIPVVGEFAAAQQPVIVVLSEGTLMNIQAVVSDDRRYVRLTVVPFFSQIGDVDTFTFEGSTSTSSSSSSTDDDGDGNDNSNGNQNQNFTAGTTVQLPTFSFVSVSTTVSVPDGGTVLLGGIKRLSEGRSEVGVPLLSKLPYVNRLFKNVGIGRETDSLMMMVTPRIIIQEEEEERAGVAIP